MDAGRRDAGGERIAQGGIKLSALRRPGLRTVLFVAALPDPSHHFTVAQPTAAIAQPATAVALAVTATAIILAQPTATIALAAAALAAAALAPAATATRSRSRAGTCDSLHNQLHCYRNY